MIIVALAVLEQQQVRQGRRERTVWVKQWLLGSVTLGHNDTLMQELMRKLRGDFKAFLRIEPPKFQGMADRLNTRISKHQDCWPGLPGGLSQHTDSVRLLRGHRTGIVQFLCAGHEDYTVTVRFSVQSLQGL